MAGKWSRNIRRVRGLSYTLRAAKPNATRQMESDIENLEQDIDNLDNQMNCILPFDELQILMTEREQKESALEMKMQNWEELLEKIDELENVLRQNTYVIVCKITHSRSKIQPVVFFPILMFAAKTPWESMTCA